MLLDWARAAQRCQPHHQSCNPLDPRGKVEVWSTKDNLVKNCGSSNEEHEPQLGHRPEAGQWQTRLEELRCCPTCQQAWRVVMMMTSDAVFVIEEMSQQKSYTPQQHTLGFRGHVFSRCVGNDRNVPSTLYPNPLIVMHAAYLCSTLLFFFPSNQCSQRSIIWNQMKLVSFLSINDKYHSNMCLKHHQRCTHESEEPISTYRDEECYNHDCQKRLI